MCESSFAYLLHRPLHLAAHLHTVNKLRLIPFNKKYSVVGFSRLIPFWRLLLSSIAEPWSMSMSIATRPKTQQLPHLPSTRGCLAPACITLQHLLTPPHALPVYNSLTKDCHSSVAAPTRAQSPTVHRMPGADTADTHGNMERRPPSTTRSRIPGGYGNYPGRDPESPPPPESSGSGGTGGGGRKKRTPAPWGGLFKGKVRVQ